MSSPGSDKDYIEAFDLERFWYVFKHSRIWLILLILATTSLAFLYVRYTKPLYKSTSIVKLSFESEANTLGLSEVMQNQDINEISGEIELIGSRLFLSNVVKEAQLDVSYHIYGRYLTDERYKNAPFAVSHKVEDTRLLDRPFDVTLLDDTSFKLEYTQKGEQRSDIYSFGEDIQAPGLLLRLDKSGFFNSDIIGEKFFFTINSTKAAVDYMEASLEVVPENFSAKTIEISFSDYNKRKARDLVRLTDSLYLKYTEELKNKAIEKKIAFINDQIDQTEQKLSDYENYFEKFTIENRTTDLDQDINRTISQLTVLDSQRFSLKSRIRDLKDLSAQTEKKEAIIVDPLVQEDLPPSLIEALNLYVSTQAEFETKLGTYTNTSAIIKQLDTKLIQSKNNLGRLLFTYIESLEETLERINRSHRSLEANLAQLPSMGTAYTKNKRFYDELSEFMLSLQKSKIELELTKAGTVTNSVILSEASFPIHPIKPQKLLIIAAGFVLGIVLSVVFLLIKYLVHNKIASISELERLILTPLLGGVPDIKNHKMQQAAMVVDKDTNAPVSEALRTIRTNMDFLGSSQKNHVISITSTVSGEGKTFVAVNLAGIIAMSGKTVCVVDVDMRKPKVHLALQEANQEAGTSTLLSGKATLEDALIQSSRQPHLHLIPAGPVPPNPSELLLQKELDTLVETLRKKFDVVIIDTPPVGLVTDGRLIMKKSDLQLYIFRVDYSRRVYSKVINDLKTSGQYPNMAAILNSIDNTSRYGYGYGYGYYADDEKRKKRFFNFGGSYR